MGRIVFDDVSVPEQGVYRLHANAEAVLTATELFMP